MLNEHQNGGARNRAKTYWSGNKSVNYGNTFHYKASRRGREKVTEGSIKSSNKNPILKLFQAAVLYVLLHEP
jgi:hypothetical protein